MEKKTPKQALNIFEQIIKESVKDKPKVKKVKKGKEKS
jgi:hypothetical protein